MKTDTDLERLLRDALHQELDDQYGPDPTWHESPAARRVAEQERLRPRRRVVRLLGVAALVTIGVGSALVVGAPDDAPAASPNGWIAYGMQPEDGGDQDIWFVGVNSEPRRAVGSDTDNVDQICPAFSPDGRSLAYGEVDRSGATPATAVVVAAVRGDGEVSEQFRVDVGQVPVQPVRELVEHGQAAGVVRRDQHVAGELQLGQQVSLDRPRASARHSTVDRSLHAKERRPRAARGRGAPECGRPHRSRR